MRGLIKTHKHLFLSLYHDLSAQCIDAEKRIREAIIASLEDASAFSGADVDMLVATRELSDENVDENTKRVIVELMIEQRISFKQAFDNPDQEQRIRFPPVAVNAFDARPIMEIFHAFFPRMHFSIEIDDLMEEICEKDEREYRKLAGELDGHRDAIHDLFFDILMRNHEDGESGLELEDLDDSHFLPGEKTKIVQEMIDQREILVFKLLKALGRGTA